ncbi:DNA-directed RNA polymerase subunit beta' [Candidatus Hakubella thermalkaliphila]|uniref:DNA-directed RNA polymerase subunit beta' n=1 Tax=Candidatus Hakubella thermalkaliphila TaxID=2754717 RepID=A0A6V8P8M4_9ACTN|nr:DNA-directed RNA polymerase subunit beta' [Candidatus Hakubella thermalkaliphila]GFP27331.1 DNA-directed RNA polymerase subunit beta' [Candidatus Hakubella thermalkaliphila]GFP35149.1 DNA-directed RNA polymerase subunit beta' [Candidatus Hakubella thermalkaliphila]
MIDVDNFNAIRIGIASPEQIRSWSNGEVKKPETINYRTLKPEKDGLFCEKIFGPTKDWECYCGKYKRVRFKGIICERCGVEVTRSRVRREKMGHIELAAPVAHIWFVKGVPSRMGYLLDISPKDLEKVLYFAAYIITELDGEKRAQDALKLEREHQEYLANIQRAHEDRIREIIEERDRRIEALKEERVSGSDGGEDEVSPGNSSLEPEIAQIMKEAEKEIAEEKEYVEELLYYARHAYDTFQRLKVKDLISDERLFKEMKERFGNYFDGGMGAEAIKKLLSQMDCPAESQRLRKIIRESTGQKRSRAIKRLKVVSAFNHSTNNPQNMILEVIPVIPPDLRPMVQLDGGRFATSDLNDLYRRVINRNNRLKRLLDLGAPEIIVNNEKRMLQEAVDALFDNGRRGKAVVGAGNRPLKSLSDMLKGKQGRFRQNLLGKRVDYSGRSVIIVGPNLKLYQCGLPKLMALELYKPFVMKRLVDLDYVQNIKSAKRMVERMRSIVWDVLEEVIEDHPVLLNRAPTLHRLGIQAFMPVLIEGKAIQIHPLVCGAFNADFDGDQMAVHVPLSAEAQAEAKVLMLSMNNVLSPANGNPIMTSSQDMVLGCYYMTVEKEQELGEGKFFSSPDETIMAYSFGRLALHAPINVRLKGKMRRTTVGRIIFNETLPQDYEYVNTPVSKKELVTILAECAERYPISVVTEVMDRIKEIGFRFATRAGLTIGMDDIDVPPAKDKILENTEKLVEKIEKAYQLGRITDDERYQRVVQIWSKATEDVADAMEAYFDKFNPIYMMANSGARGNVKQLRQLSGMRGLVANARGDIIDRPIKANFREGLSVLEYFLSTHGARQGLADTALRTADSGYLTRRLVDVAQEVIVRQEDCGTDVGIRISVLTAEGDPNSSLPGRLTIDPVVNSFTGEILINKGEMIENRHLNFLVVAGVDNVHVRSPLACEAMYGVCQKCYGKSLATGALVSIGEAVGIIAAQSIGEPGTQLTMRTFHTGGVASTMIQRPIKAPVSGELVISDEELKKLGLKKSDIGVDEEKGEQFISCDIENLIEKVALQVRMKDGKIFKVPVPKGERLLLIRKRKVEAGEIIARVVQTAKRKKHAHKHEKTFEMMDITSGLPRVVELFEARKPKGQALISEISGVVEIAETDRVKKVIVIGGPNKQKTYQVPKRARFRVLDGESISAGDQITEGAKDSHDILRINGVQPAQQYLVQEVQAVYKSQGVDIHDKHIEIIVRQMFKKVTVMEPGDTDFLPGQLVDRQLFQKENERIMAEGGEPAKARQTLLGITKASLATDSFLSAASFQETTRVLTDASIENKLDQLLGLKENVIIGKSIPAGTGMGRYRRIELVFPDKEKEEMVEEKQAAVGSLQNPGVA